jgi:type II secretory pathway pseudopilin PulG
MTARTTRHRRSGYSLTELVVVTMMMVILTSILITVWAAFCRPARDAAARCRLATEANLFAAALARDMGGYLPGTSGQLVLNNGSLDLTCGSLVGLQVPDPSNPTVLQLCYHGVNPDPLVHNNMTPKWNAPDVVVNYLLCPTHGNHVVRVVGNPGGSCPFGGTVAANEVTGFNVASWSSGATPQGFQVTLTVTSAERSTSNLSLTYALVALSPGS